MQLKIFDAKGQVVNQQEYKSAGRTLQVPTMQLKPGTYMVLLQTVKGAQTLKLIKQ